MSEKNILKVNGIKKSFKISKKNQKEVLKGIDFFLKKEEILTIMGPSGGGKSTFLKILAGILKADEGDIFFDTKNIQENLQAYTSQIGFVFQEYRLIPHLNAFENVSLALRLRGVEDWEERAHKALKFLHIDHLANNYPPQLSGGECQRVGIARAICIQPQIVFADEPTGNLDRRIAKEIMNVFSEIKETFGTSFVIVTHDIFMQAHSDRTYYLSEGVLLERDPNED